MMAGHGGIAGRLYRGDVSVNFVGRQRLWYAISGVIVLVSVVALLVHGLNFSVEFRGGDSFQFPVTAASSGSVPVVQGDISRIVSQAGGGSSTVQKITSLTNASQWSVQTGSLSSTVQQNVASALEKAYGFTQDKLTLQIVGPTWGSSITQKAIEALIIFLVVIVIYLSIAFEWRMAVAAFVALLHDIVITIGVYALTGFSVSPTTVIGLLTILGYSLYDTVVVFDKVRENTAGLLTTQRSTYSDAANMALNQTLVRSINTSLTALLPVGSILFIGAGVLGAGTLKDLALVLFVGMLSGTYSSIFIATPVLADLKEREPKYKELAAKVKRRAAGGRSAQRAAAGGTGESEVASATTAPVAVGRGQASQRNGGPAVRPDEANEPADMTVADEADETTEPDNAGLTVSASASRAAEPPRQTVRQQQRRGGSAQRRPGARKKKG
jgi:preprotein translocase subunit SecF